MALLYLNLGGSQGELFQRRRFRKRPGGETAASASPPTPFLIWPRSKAGALLFAEPRPSRLEGKIQAKTGSGERRARWSGVRVSPGPPYILRERRICGGLLGPAASQKRPFLQNTNLDRRLGQAYSRATNGHRTLKHLGKFANTEMRKAFACAVIILIAMPAFSLVAAAPTLGGISQWLSYVSFRR